MQAWVVLLLGGIALSLAGGIFAEMIPSRPPRFTPAAEATDAPALVKAWSAGWVTLKHYRLVALASVFFVLSASARFYGRRPSADIESASRTRRAFGQLKKDWFGLLVGNAFGALIATYIARWITFSFERSLFQGLLAAILSTIWQFISPVFGPSLAGALQDWWQWGMANNTRFMFWMFFIGSVLDDLGLPNFKTLARWSWRRLRHRINPALQAGH